MAFGRWTFSAAVAAALAAAMIVGGCAADGSRARQTRHIGSDVLGALTPQALRDAYRTPAFVVRDVQAGKYKAVHDTDLAADSQIDDTNLLVWSEGSADTVESFRRTVTLLAESPYGFATQPEKLVIIVLKWSHGIDTVVEHLNRESQDAGAVLLADMLEVHRQRHGAAGHVGLVGFSAGTRVIERAFLAAASHGQDGHPEAFACVDNVVLLGSSIGFEEATPYEMVRGRFINFVNPRDTHYGDRAPYIAPAGGTANPLHLLQQATLERRPRFGASVTGFRNLPVLTAVDQFDAAEMLERLGEPAAGESPQKAAAHHAFRMVNVPVPATLVPFNLFGTPLVNDDFDDYLNQAPNHYIMVARGPAGRTDTPDFRQYRAASEEFVRDFVAPAAFRGRLNRFDLKTVTKGADPIGLPIFVPWAIFNIGPQQQPPEPDDAKSPQQKPGP